MQNRYQALTAEKSQNAETEASPPQFGSQADLTPGMIQHQKPFLDGEEELVAPPDASQVTVGDMMEDEHYRVQPQSEQQSLFEILDHKLPTRREVLQDVNDQVFADIVNLIENFEKVFVAFINENYRTFTESDLQRIIHDELRQNILAKVKELGANQAFTNCDPFKIRSILEHHSAIKASNEAIRSQAHQVGVTVNQLAKTLVDMKKDVHVEQKASGFIQELAKNIDRLNHLFNDVHLRVLESDSQLSSAEVVCKTTLSSHGHLHRIDQLEKGYAKLESINLELKQQMTAQASEYKKLQQDFELAHKKAEANFTQNHRVQNLEKIIEELRADNRSFMDKIEDLQVTIFGKERQIDKLRHQLKHGVVAQGISSTFDHAYSGPGGSIQSGVLRSKVELATEQQTLISQA